MTKPGQQRAGAERGVEVAGAPGSHVQVGGGEHDTQRGPPHPRARNRRRAATTGCAGEGCGAARPGWRATRLRTAAHSDALRRVGAGPTRPRSGMPWTLETSTRARADRTVVTITTRAGPCRASTTPARAGPTRLAAPVGPAAHDVGRRELLGGADHGGEERGLGRTGDGEGEGRQRGEDEDRPTTGACNTMAVATASMATTWRA